MKFIFPITEKKGLKPDMNISWDDAKPTKTHMAISKLTKEKMCQFVMSQNIDGLHLRSGKGTFSNYDDKKRLLDGPKMTLFKFIR